MWRTCDNCCEYFASKKQVKLHNSHHKQRSKRIITKTDVEALCELEIVEPTVNWVDREEIIELVRESQEEKISLAEATIDIFPVISIGPK